MGSFFKDISARWKWQMPTLFKKISNQGKAVAATGTALLASQAIPNVHLPSALVHIGVGMVTAGTVASVVSNLTVADTSKLPPDSQK